MSIVSVTNASQLGKKLIIGFINKEKKVLDQDLWIKSKSGKNHKGLNSSEIRPIIIIFPS